MDKDSNSISFISSKKLDAESPPPPPPPSNTTSPSPQVYVNQAFDSNSYDKDSTATTKPSTAESDIAKGKDGTKISGTPDADTTVTTSATTATSTNATTTITTTSKSGQSGLYDDISNSKRNHSHGSVEFSMPDKRRESRLKSISEGGPYRGMGKEELLRFSSRPLWRNLRYASITIVLMGWLALLITVVALVLTYPPCRSRDSLSTAWWQKSVIYRVYVRSFKDGANGDGIGDIKGLRDELDYIQSIGADTISLSPIYKIGGDDCDTDIVDHKEIDPVFGTLAEFKLLLNETHTRGMHLILDFVPNHTSKKHHWFNKSAEDPNGRSNTYGSYYVWTEGNTPINNWASVQECSAWTKQPANGKNFHYLHQFMSTQPDLNLRSDKVKDALEDILIFWLDLGVDGFYIRDSDFLFEDYDMRDEELIDNSTGKTQNCLAGDHHPYNAFSHKYTKGLDQNLEMVARWRALLDVFSEETERYRVLIADVIGPIEHVMTYYGLFNSDGVNFPLNPFSRQLNVSKGGVEVGGMVSDWMNSMPKGRWANWMSGDDRTPRFADLMGERFSRPYLTLIMLLPGTPFVLYGDEIGMRSLEPTPSMTTRGLQKPMRSPMPWSNSTNRGFCEPQCTRPWMETSEGQLDVESQMANSDSIWNLFKNLTTLRKDNPSFEYGDFSAALQDEDIYSFVREFDGEKGYLVALNFGSEEAERSYPGSHDTIPGSATIELTTQNGDRIGSSVSLHSLTLVSGEGIVVSWDYEAKEL